MFCPNCGNIVSKDDNYCKVCGKNLKNVKIKVESLDSTTPVKAVKMPKTKDVTRVFNPKDIDGIDTTDDIKNIIAEVDKKISKNIKEYEKRSSEDALTNKEKEEKLNLSMEKGPSTSEKVQIKKETKAQEKIDSKDNFNISKKELIRRVQEELKKSPKISSDDYLEEEEEKNIEGSKKSLKDLWKDFINEDDDEFSIFNSIKKDKSQKTSRIRNFEITNTSDVSNKSLEDTMSVPKIKLDKDGNVDLNVLENDSKEKTKNSPKKVQKNFHDVKPFQGEKIEKTEKIDREESPTVKAEDFKISKEKIFGRNDEKKLLRAKEEKKPLAKKLGLKKERPLKSQDLKENLADEKSKINKLRENIEEDLSRESFPRKTESKADDFIRNNFKRLSILNINFAEFLKSYKSTESIILITLGIQLIFVQMFVGQGKFTPMLLFFLILKLIFDYLQFVVPLRIAKDQTNILKANDNTKVYCLINWFYCKFFLFLGFILTPFSGLFNFNLLKALTPMPIATIFLIIFSPAVALSFYYSELEDKKIINFVGWYAFLFILIELLTKLLWFGVNFTFNTLF
ncbi:zinc ribbon domain-containing protein [uncultured Peptoniphilus sp.]|uniref:zinc ribbon domain-containing protein n=1 Tax=uncultured Peptoniphilus sp. TaxID=254354 RepID=UPI002805CFE5|nr:zinc ribbon domain-containing protein [uncultured Peptoniphilus sp.]